MTTRRLATEASHEEPSGDGRAEAVEALMDVSRLMTAVVAQTLGTLDQSVSVPQLRVLVMLQSNGPMNLGEIAEGLGVNPSNATRACDRLVEASLVRRRVEASDRRVVEVSLAAKGRRLVAALMDRRRRIFDELIAPMSFSDQQVLVEGLAAFLGAVEHSAEDAGLEVGRAALLHWVR